MTYSVVSTLHRRVLPFTLSLRLLSLTAGPSVAAILDVKAARAVTNDVVAEQFAVTDLLEATNSARLERGLPALRLDSQLMAAAARKVLDMREKGYWDHFRPSDNKAPWDFITESGYRYTVAGENLARGFQSVQGITKAWLESPAHRANLLSDRYTDIGFADAIITQPDGTRLPVTVQMFASR
jgi:uncharacterized protein YkwD